MYQSYFGLREQAFSIAVDPRYLYMSRQHQEALAHLIYGVQGGGFVLLSGEVGTGKTTIVKQLLEKLPKRTDIAIILNPMANVIDLLTTMCEELGIGFYTDDMTVKKLTDALHNYLLANHSKGHNTVLLIDEAQLLSPEVLEELRLLTNLETSAKKLLQIILVGQPELNALLSQPRLRQLSQRITARFHLKPLSQEETHAYIRHRLAVAGMPPERNPFSEKIVNKVYGFSNGIPRRINVLCERLMIGAFGHNKPKIDQHIFKLACSEITLNLGENQAVTTTKTVWLPMAIGILSAAASALAVWLVLSKNAGTHSAPTYNSVPAMPTSQAQPNATHNIRIGSLPAGSPFVFTSLDQAQTQLASIIKSTAQSTTQTTQIVTNPCLQTQAVYGCSQRDSMRFDDITKINRPAIIALHFDNNPRAFVIVTGINNTIAQLAYKGNFVQYVNEQRSNLTPYWQGDMWYLWRKPQSFDEPLFIGQSDPAVGDVAAIFAKLDNQSNPLTRGQFNLALKKRIQIFQKNNGLQSDGVITETLLLKLNEKTKLDKTLDKL